jgi:hypothetical protein
LEFKNKLINDYLRIIGLILIFHSLIMNQLISSLVVFGLLILLDEVIRPFFKQKESKSLEELTAQLEQVQIDLNSIKLDKAIRKLSDV